MRLLYSLIFLGERSVVKESSFYVKQRRRYTFLAVVYFMLALIWILSGIISQDNMVSVLDFVCAIINGANGIIYLVSRKNIKDPNMLQ